MKKVLSIILSVFIISLSLSINCFANETVSLSLQDEKVYAGDEFTVNLFVSDNSKISGAVIEINYDKSKLEFVSAKEGAILDPNANISIRNIKDKSLVRFTYMAGGSQITSEGVLCSVTFKALESSNGKTDLKISIPSPADFVSANLEKIPYRANNSTITILNDIPTEIMSETETETETVSVELSTDSLEETESETVTLDDDIADNENSNDYILSIILILLGLAFICFGVVLAIKKKKA